MRHHRGRPPGEQTRGLELGLHLDHVALDRAQRVARGAVADLDAYCRERLAAYKVPKTYEFLDTFLRSEAGKVRRSALVAERESGWTPGMVAVGRAGSG